MLSVVLRSRRERKKGRILFAHLKRILKLNHLRLRSLTRRLQFENWWRAL